MVFCRERWLQSCWTLSWAEKVEDLEIDGRGAGVYVAVVVVVLIVVSGDGAVKAASSVLVRT